MTYNSERGIREALEWAQKVSAWFHLHHPVKWQYSGGLKLDAAVSAVGSSEPTDPWGKPLAPQTGKVLRGELGTHEPKE